MSRKTVRVEIPTGRVDDLIALCQGVLAKHTADGLASPLDAAKMAKFQSAVGPADTNNTQAKQLDGQAQTLRQQRDTLMGIADGQSAATKDTGLNLLTCARDQLLLVNEGNEEALSQYGFNVVVGSAKSPTRKAKTS